MASKKELLAQEISKVTGAGKSVSLETVDFNDPNRPKTCLEVDFAILPINQVAAIEGPSSKPIYQMSKWWARRRSSVFRSILLAAATKAPSDITYSSKLIWENYYANHLRKGGFKQLKVADIFMGGGTTLIEGSRLGMQMVGNDLNPVAWFVVKQAMSNVDIDEVKRMLSDVEAAVKPQIMPYFYCDGPEGEKGKWIHIESGRVEGSDFDPLSIPPEQRFDYRYEGPEIIYTFWGKHGPCQVTGCGHRTPIMTRPVVAVKSLSVKYWDQNCGQCGLDFHVEEEAARMAPDVPMYVAPSEHPYSILDRKRGVTCPGCGHTALRNLGKGKNKKVELSLLVQPQWLAGSPNLDDTGNPFGGSAQDDAASTAAWHIERSSKINMLEVRGELPAEATCPETNVTFKTGIGTVPKKSSYACAACGTTQDVLTTVRATRKTGPSAPYAIHGYSAKRRESGAPYNGRFFAPFSAILARQLNAAYKEWELRRETDLAQYWPKSDVPFGFMTNLNNGDIVNGHGYRRWIDMFNSRQALVHSLLLHAIENVGTYNDSVREAVLGCFQQYLRNNNMFTLWNIQADQLEPMFSNNNFHPKQTTVENSVFGEYGRGNWNGCARGIVAGYEWARNPWEIVAKSNLQSSGHHDIANEIQGKGFKVFSKDPIQSAHIECASSTDLNTLDDQSIDLVITDPPFGGLLHYSELSDFFYVWLQLFYSRRLESSFSARDTPKSLEAVSNRAREPEDPDGFYQRLLTQCWREAHRILKPGGILAFTFHHSEDEPWIAVLESLFDAGFYLEATYPIRSDETKGEGAKPGTFGSQTIEYDIIHVCRKRTNEPQSVSWGRMRREVMADVRQLQAMLENHAKEGLPAADIQVIRRGKALEYFSRHYGRVYVDEDRAISVKEALVGINQLIDEDADKGNEPPPVNAEPITRQFLRTFGRATELKRDQLQKFLKGSITTPDEFEQRAWCSEKNKIFTRVSPLDFAREWSGKHKRRLTSDLDQALVLVGACFDGSGINASDTLKNENFKPHVALKPLLEWLHRNGADQAERNAASRAVTIYNSWSASQATKAQQGSLFEEYDQ